MGTYATTTSISELMPGYLIGNTTTSDTPGVNLFSRHIDRAEGIVNAYIGTRYNIVAMTTTNYPPIMRTLSEDIACWYAARAAYVQDGGKKQEYLDKFEMAMDTLKDIRDGETGLTYTNGAEVPPKSSSRFLTDTDYTPVFGLDDPESWKVDEDQIDDLENARD